MEDAISIPALCQDEYECWINIWAFFISCLAPTVQILPSLKNLDTKKNFFVRSQRPSQKIYLNIEKNNNVSITNFFVKVWNE